MRTIAKIETSKNYDQFSFIVGNRPIDPTNFKYRKLKESMKHNGWIESFPATVCRKDRKLLIIDGQNRFTAAKELGIPVLYVETKRTINIAKLSECFRAWNSNDYAGSHAADGNNHYKLLIDFCTKHNITCVRGANLLCAKSKAMIDGSGGAHQSLKDGSFEFTEDGKVYAELVLRVCSHLPKNIRKNRTANAAVARLLLINEVNPEILIQKIDTNISCVVPKGTIQDYIHMFESVYNKRNPNPVPIYIKTLEYYRAK
jgi:hypothetical protein